MTTLRIDADVLLQQSKAISTVRTSLSNVRSTANEVAGTVGHDRLAAKVREFGSKWDITRSKLDERLLFVEESLTAIRETFEELDGSLAEQATEATETPAEGDH